MSNSSSGSRSSLPGKSYSGEMTVNGHRDVWCSFRNRSVSFQTSPGVVKIRIAFNGKDFQVFSQISFLFKSCQISIYRGDDTKPIWFFSQTSRDERQSVPSHVCRDDFRLAIQLELFDPEPSVTQAFLELCESPKLSDVVFLVDGAKICAHRGILAARSSFFDGMFRLETGQEIELVDVSARGFKAILRYLYGGALLSDEESNLAPEVLPKAHEWCLDPLVEACAALMDRYVDVNNVCDFFRMGGLYSLETLTSRCANFLKNHMVSVRLTDGWKQLRAADPETALDLLEATFI